MPQRTAITSVLFVHLTVNRTEEQKHQTTNRHLTLGSPVATQWLYHTRKTLNKEKLLHWHWQYMPSVMCSISEFKWGLHNKGHHRPSAIPVVWRFQHHKAWPVHPMGTKVLNHSSDTLHKSESETRTWYICSLHYLLPTQQCSKSEHFSSRQ